MKRLLATTLLLAVVLPAASAAAQTVYDWPSAETPVVVHDGSGVLFLGKDKTVFRAYTWRENKGDHAHPAWFLDIDRNGKPEVVGAGKPTFGLRANGDPWWFHSGGCDQVLVSDFALDNKMDILCLDGKTINIRTYDWQLVWKVSIGRRFDWCRAGDVNGDLKSDIECKWHHSKKYTRLDGSSGEVLAAETTDEEIPNPKYESVDPVGKDSLAGKKEYDLDGDGTAEESVIADGSAIVVKSRSHKKALARIATKGKPVAIVVKDLDGDKKLDIVAVTPKQIVITDPLGKKTKKFSANAKSYHRKAVAKLQSVYANGFDKNDEAAQKAVHDVNDKLARCYSGEVRKNQFAGTGTVLMEVDVDEKGKVGKVHVHHSSLADDRVVKCASHVLKRAKFPKAGGNGGAINITMQYTFRDE